MRNTAILLFAFFIAIAFQSCYKKNFCSCDFEPVLHLECKIVSPQGQNLVFGSLPVYKIDSIRVLRSYNNLSIYNASVRQGLTDASALRLDFPVIEAKNYVYYNQQSKTDTLEINWEQKTGKCCNGTQTYYTLGAVKFNGSAVQPQNGIYHFVK